MPVASSMLEHHLQYNHYPPIPQEWVKVAKEAIEAVNEGVRDAEIDLPRGVLYKGRDWIPAAKVIRQFHLHDFLDSDESEDDGMGEFDV